MSSKFGLHQKATLQNRTEAGKELDFRRISDSHLFPGYNVSGLDINNTISTNNICS